MVYTVGVAPAVTEPCPPEERLFAAVEGRLDAASRSTIEAHVDRCGECQAVLAALARLRSWTASRVEPGGAPAAVAGAELDAGDRLGAYEVVGLLGRGGMGAVFEAFDPRLERRVAIKVVLPGLADAAGRGRLLAEARALARIAHPNVVTVHEVQADAGSIYVVMELLEGETLAAWLAAGARPRAEVLAVLAGIAEGLAAVHRGGVVHRDVKPSNVIVGADGRPRLIDFGLARDPELGAGPGERGLVGTPAYMAPEQLQRAAMDARGDVFALGLVAYEALHGRRPFAGARTLEDRLRAISGGPPPRLRRDLPRRLRRLLQASLAVDPGVRPTAEALARVLRPRAGRGLPLAAAALVGLGLVGLGLGLAARGPGGPDLCVAEAVAADLERAWGPARRAALADRYAASGLADGPVVAPALLGRIDRRVDRWRELHAEACAAPTPAAAADPLALARTRADRLACLDLRLAEIDGLVELLLAGDPELLALGPRFLSELRDLEGCRDPAAIDAEPPLPEAARARAEVIALRGLQVQVRALVDAGREDEARIRAQEALARAQALGSPAFVAEAELSLGVAHPAERGRVEAAAFAASRAGARRTYAVAALARAAHLGLEGDDLEAAAIWLGHGAAVLGSLGDDPDTEGLHAWIDGALLARQGRLVEARERLVVAVERFRAAHGDDALVVVTRPLLALGVVERGLGEGARALAIFERGIAEVTAQLGEGSRLLPTLHLHRAATLLDRGALDEAAAALDRVAARLAGEPALASEVGRWLAEERLRLAEARGDPAAAADAARALATAAAADRDALGEALARCTRAEHLLALGRVDAALAELERAQALEGRIFTAHELAGRDAHRRLVATLRDAYLHAGRPEAARALQAHGDALRIRVLREFSDRGFAGAEVCLVRGDARECVVADDDGQAVFTAGAGAGAESAAQVRVTAPGFVPTLMPLGSDLGGAFLSLTLFRPESVAAIAGYFGRGPARSGGLLLGGLEGPAHEGIAGGVLRLEPAGGAGPHYLTELGGFSRDRQESSRNSRGAVGWLDLPPGDYALSVRHPGRRCRPPAVAREGAAPGSIAVAIEAGALTRAPDFRCDPPLAAPGSAGGRASRGGGSTSGGG